MVSPMNPKYIPHQGDLIFVNFNPQAGREQAGKRPALVLSPWKYNEATGLMICAPVTSKMKDYPFEVKLPNTLKIKGVVLADHIRNVDWKIRKARFVEKAPSELLRDVIQKINTLINIRL